MMLLPLTRKLSVSLCVSCALHSKPSGQTADFIKRESDIATALPVSGVTGSLLEVRESADVEVVDKTEQKRRRERQRLIVQPNLQGTG
jgi:hypothetical protein